MHLNAASSDTRLHIVIRFVYKRNNERYIANIFFMFRILATSEYDIRKRRNYVKQINVSMVPEDLEGLIWYAVIEYVSS